MIRFVKNFVAWLLFLYVVLTMHTFIMGNTSSEVPLLTNYQFQHGYFYEDMFLYDLLFPSGLIHWIPLMFVSALMLTLWWRWK